jgi:NhaA family Na+:H+ antiporter
VALDRQALGDAVGSRLTWAVVVGLVLGKLLGIAGAAVAGVRTGILAGSLVAAVLGVAILSRAAPSD